MDAREFFESEDQWGKLFRDDQVEFDKNDMANVLRKFSKKYPKDSAICAVDINHRQEFLFNAENELGDSAVAGENGDYTNVATRSTHGSETQTAVESALPPIPDAENGDTEVGVYRDGNWYCKCCGNLLAR